MVNILTCHRDASIDEKVDFLRRPETYPTRPARVEVIETHMSWVFLGDTLVYKLKKPVRYEFLDFSTLEARRLNCQREVELNRRLAPDVYRGTVPLTLRSDGSLHLGGPDHLVDWLPRTPAADSRSVSGSAARPACPPIACSMRRYAPIRSNPRTSNRLLVC